MGRALTIADFQAEDLACFVPQQAQAGEAELRGGAERAAELGPAFTVFCEDPGGVRVLGCAGLARNHDGHATAWGLFAEGLSYGEWAALTRIAQGVIAAASARRVDMLVRAGFERAERYAAHLGFDREGVLRSFGTDGADFILFARVRED